MTAPVEIGAEGAGEATEAGLTVAAAVEGVAATVGAGLKDVKQLK